MSEMINQQAHTEEVPYSVYSKFDIEKHKKYFIDYLEVVILEDGTIEYAVPSHTLKVETICCKQLNVSRKELILLTREHIFDYAEWLLTICNAIMVWNKFYLTGYNGININQKIALERLKQNGLYKGKI